MYGNSYGHRHVLLRKSGSLCKIRYVVPAASGMDHQHSEKPDYGTAVPAHCCRTFCTQSIPQRISGRKSAGINLCRKKLRKPFGLRSFPTFYSIIFQQLLHLHLQLLESAHYAERLLLQQLCPDR